MSNKEGVSLESVVKSDQVLNNGCILFEDSRLLRIVGRRESHIG